MAHLLQPVEEAHRDAGRGTDMSVAYGCCEAKRVTGRAEEKCASYNTLHGRRADGDAAPREREGENLCGLAAGSAKILIRTIS